MPPFDEPTDDIESLLDPPAKPKPAPKRKGIYDVRPDRVRSIPEGAENWNINDFDAIGAEFRKRTGKAVPTRAFGQGNIHNQQGWDHRNATDAGINPNSPEGKALIAILDEQGVPYQVFNRAVKNPTTGRISSTGPHIHIGLPSKSTTQRFPVGTRATRTNAIPQNPVVADDIESLLDPPEQAPAAQAPPANVSPLLTKPFTGDAGFSDRFFEKFPKERANYGKQVVAPTEDLNSLLDAPQQPVTAPQTQPVVAPNQPAAPDAPFSATGGVPRVPFANLAATLLQGQGDMPDVAGPQDLANLTNQVRKDLAKDEQRKREIQRRRQIAAQQRQAQRAAQIRAQRQQLPGPGQGIDAALASVRQSEAPSLLGQPTPMQNIADTAVRNPANRMPPLGRPMRQRAANPTPGFPAPAIQGIAESAQVNPANELTPEDIRREQIRDQIRTEGGTYGTSKAASLIGPAQKGRGIEAEIDRRIAEQDRLAYRNEQIRKTYTEQDKQEIDNMADTIMGRRNLGRAGTESANELTKEIIDAAAGALKIVRLMPTSETNAKIEADLENYLNRQGLSIEDALARAEESKPKTTEEKGLKVLTGLGFTLPTVGALTAIAGPEVAFGAPAFLGSVGRGEGYAKATITGAKQAATGALFRGTGGMPLGPRVAGTALGTAGLDIVAGDKPDPRTILMNTAFAALGGGRIPSLTETVLKQRGYEPYTVRSESGKTATVYAKTTENGAVTLARPIGEGKAVAGRPEQVIPDEIFNRIVPERGVRRTEGRKVAPLERQIAAPEQPVKPVTPTAAPVAETQPQPTPAPETVSPAKPPTPPVTEPTLNKGSTVKVGARTATVLDVAGENVFVKDSSGREMTVPKDRVRAVEKAKEPWEMTRDEWEQKHQRTRGGSPDLQGASPMERGRPVPLTEAEARTETRKMAGGRTAFHSDGTVTIHRGVNAEVNDLAPGDFVTLDAAEAQQYANKQGGKVITLRVPQADVAWVFDAKGPHPLRYAPNGALSVRMAHRLAIERALAEGKPVPPEVLADYPDLQPKDRVTPVAEQPVEQPAPPKPKRQRVARGLVEEPDEAAVSDAVEIQHDKSKPPIVVRDLTEALKRYDDTDSIGIDDLANIAEGLIDRGKAPASLQDVVDKYRAATTEDIQQYGGRSGLGNEAAEALERALRNAIKKNARPTGPKRGHEKTLAEYLKSAVGPENQSRKMHRANVEYALRNGETVAPEVLKDYPDLAKSAPTPAPVAAPAAKEAVATRDETDATDKYEAQQETLKNYAPNPDKLKSGKVDVGDWVGIRKSERASGITGVVTKVNRKTVEIQTFYHPRPGTVWEQSHKINRSDITDLATAKSAPKPQTRTRAAQAAKAKLSTLAPAGEPTLAPKGKAKEPWAMTRAEFADAVALDTDHRAQYFDKDGNKIADSRMEPSKGVTPPVGTWRIVAGSSGWNKYGDIIEQLRDVPVDKIQGAEDPIAEGRKHDVERYTEWAKEGKSAPPIRGALRPDGTFRISDGHRRLEAARRAGLKTIKAWVADPADTGLFDSEGKMIDTDLTHQLAVKQAIKEGKPVPAEVLAEYPDLAPKPKTTRTRTAQAAKRAAKAPAKVEAVRFVTTPDEIRTINPDTDAYDLADELIDNGARITIDGNVELFHRTTPDQAAEIVRTGKMTGKEDGLFFSTEPVGQAEGFGEGVVKLSIPLSKLELDDTFGGEAHVRIPLSRAGIVKDVSAFKPAIHGDVKPAVKTESPAKAEPGMTFAKGRVAVDGQDKGVLEFTKKSDRIEVDKIYLKPTDQKQGLGRSVISKLFNDNPDVKVIEAYPLGTSEPFWFRVADNVRSDGTVEITRDSFAKGQKHFSRQMEEPSDFGGEPPAPKKQQRKTPRGIRQHGATMRAAGLDAPDVEYTEQTVEGWKSNAENKIAELGVEGAIKHYKDLPDGDEGNKYLLGDKLLDHLTPGTPEFDDLAAHQIIHTGEAAQTLRAAQEVSRRDPKNAVKYTDMAIRRVKKRGITTEEAARVQKIADKQIVVNERKAIADKALDAIEKKQKPKKSKVLSLSEYVAAKGGIREDLDNVNHGEVDRLRGAGKRRLVNNKSGMSVEDMAREAYRDGYLHDIEGSVDDAEYGHIDPDVFMQAVEADASGTRRYHRAEDLEDSDIFDDWERFERDQANKAESEQRIQFLEDPEVEDLLERLTKNPTDADALSDLYVVGGEHGLTEDAIAKAIKFVTEPGDTEWLAPNDTQRPARKDWTPPKPDSQAGERVEYAAFRDRDPEGFARQQAQRAAGKKPRSGRATARKITYEVRLKQQAEEALAKLKGRKLDFGGMLKTGERGAIRFSIERGPLQGDAELVAEWLAPNLGRMESTASLTKTLIDNFGTEIESHVKDIRDRAYTIRAEARRNEIKNNPVRRQTILTEIRQEIQAANQAIRDADAAASKARRAAVRTADKDQRAKELAREAELRQQVQQGKLDAREARRIALDERKQAAERSRAAKAADVERKKALSAEARAQKFMAQKELSAARKQETKDYRETIKAQKARDREEGLWDTATRRVAAEARERLKTATDAKDATTHADLVAAARGELLPDEIGGSARMKATGSDGIYRFLNSFPNLQLTRRDAHKIFKEAYEAQQDLIHNVREITRMRSASKESAALWDKFWAGEPGGRDVTTQALLLERADLQRQANELRLEQQREFERLSQGLVRRALSWTGGSMRGLKSSIDSPLGRQGLAGLLAHPLETIKTIPTALNAYNMSAKEFERYQQEFTQRPGYELARDAMGIKFDQTEEQFYQSAATRLPHVKRSEQGYSAQMNEQRLAIANLYAIWGEFEGYTPENNPKFYKEVGRIINVMSGRGDLTEKQKAFAQFTQDLLYSPRLNISRIQMIKDAVTLPFKWKTYDPVTRQIYATNLLKTAMALMITYGMAALFGLDVGTNALTPDFGKIRKGNTRWDPTGGEAGMVRMLVVLAMKAGGASIAAPVLNSAARQISSTNLPGSHAVGSYLSSGGQELKKTKTGAYSVGSDLFKQLRYKLAPLPGAAIEAGSVATNYAETGKLEGKDAVGQPVTVKPDIYDPLRTMQTNLFLRMIEPMLVGSFIEGYQDSGIAGLAKTTPALLGFGVNTYTDKPKKDGRTGKQGINTSHLSPTVEAQRKAAAARRKAAAQH